MLQSRVDKLFCDALDSEYFCFSHVGCMGHYTALLCGMKVATDEMSGCDCVAICLFTKAGGGPGLVLGP